MLLETIIPNLPNTNLQIAIFAVTIVGAILIIYSQFVEAENRRDLIRMIGAMCLLVYSLSILNIVFIITSFGIFIACLVEFIEIYLGYHHHTRKDVEIYEYIGGRRKK